MSLANQYGIALLKNWREEQQAIAQKPSVPPFACPECGRAVNMRFGRHAETFNAFHDGSACHFTGHIWHLAAQTIEAARDEWAALTWDGREA